MSRSSEAPRCQSGTFVGSPLNLHGNSSVCSILSGATWSHRCGPPITRQLDSDSSSFCKDHRFPTGSGPGDQAAAGIQSGIYPDVELLGPMDQLQPKGVEACLNIGYNFLFSCFRQKFAAVFCDFTFGLLPTSIRFALKPKSDAWALENGGIWSNDTRNPRLRRGGRSPCC